MVAGKRKKEKGPALVIESHPEDYNGVPWATLILYAGKHHLVVVNTLDDNFLWAYSIESMRSELVDVFCGVMDSYWAADLYDKPLREYVSPDQWITERGMNPLFGRQMSVYNTDNIARLIGPVRAPEILPEKQRVRRRKRVDINKNLVKKS